MHVAPIPLVAVVAVLPLLALGGGCRRSAEVDPAEAAPLALEIRTPRANVELTWVPGGRFLLGSPEGEPSRQTDEGPVHEVEVSGFWVMRTEVTQGLHTELTGDDPAQRQNFWGRKDRGPCAEQDGVSLADPTFPAVCLTWFDAVALANTWSAEEGLTPAYTVDGFDVTWHRDADGYRLLTEAEWEYAARGGVRGERFAGAATDEAVCEVANVGDASARTQWPDLDTVPCDDGTVGLAPVGAYRPNRFGLFDMTGNAREWVWDWYGDRYYGRGPTRDPAGPEVGLDRAIRSGGWNISAWAVRLANRSAQPPTARGHSIGVRLARSGPPPG